MSVVGDPDETAADRTSEPAALGSYQLLERIGVGALGEVFRARDTLHGRTVAIKRIPSALAADADRLATLEETAARLTAVTHPGVAMLYECACDDGQWFLAQEFVAGQPLPQLLGGQPINPRRAVDLALEMAEALASLHAAGLRHGDVRPESVMVTQKGHAKLLDAGLGAFTGAGAIRASAPSRLGTLTPDMLPVVRALSPEEAMGEGGDARADLSGLGVVLYEMLTGQSPYDRATADDALMAVLRMTPPPASTRQPTVTRALDLVVARALAKPLASRYQSASGLADDLRAVKASLDAEAVQSPVPGVGVQAPRRPWLAWAAALAALAGAAGWWLFGR
jgi:serine/threonine protein kinase